MCSLTHQATGLAPSYVTKYQEPIIIKTEVPKADLWLDELPNIAPKNEVSNLELKNLLRVLIQIEIERLEMELQNYDRSIMPKKDKLVV